MHRRNPCIGISRTWPCLLGQWPNQLADPRHFLPQLRMAAHPHMSESKYLSQRLDSSVIHEQQHHRAQQHKHQTQQLERF